MPLFKVHSSSLVYRWLFRKMLLSLPFPFLPAFSNVSQALRPFGIQPASVSWQNQNNNLDDIGINIGLLDDRIILRLAYAGIELRIPQLYREDDPNNDAALIKDMPIAILNAIFKALTQIDEAICEGQGRITCYAQLELLDLESNKFLSDNLHLQLSELTSPYVIPDTVAYKLQLRNSEEIQAHRILFAKSLQIEKYLYVEYVAEPLAGLTDFNNIYEQYVISCKEALSIFELKHQSW